ncbi:hypothetical protein Tco_0500448 [Tanacetum coccineum]
MINSQICVKDKTGLGFDSYVNESEVLDNVVDSHECDQVNYWFKKSEGYHAVPPPYTGNFKPARADLSFAGLDDSVYKSKMSETITSVPNVETTTSKTSKDSLEKAKTVRHNAPIIEDWESDSEDENVFAPKEVKKTVKSSFEKIEFVNARNSTVEKPRNFSQNLRNNKRNRNGFEFTKKACFVCGSFNHLIKDCDFHDKKMVQKPVLNNVKKGTAAAPVSAVRPINTAAPKPFMNVARTRPNAFHKSHSTSRTPFNQQTTLKNRNLNYRVNTTKVNSVNTTKVNSVNTAKGVKVTSAKGLMLLSPQHAGFGDQKEMLLTISPKTIIKILMVDLLHLEEVLNEVKLDFEDVYFVKELKFNLFSTSQICDKKNNVLFTETECLVLSPDFKLLDESQVLLKIPRLNNMYSFDLKNVVPSGDFDMLFAKATIG